MSESNNGSAKREQNIRNLSNRICGIRCIDTRALGRIVEWSIANCERQLMILKCALTILADEIKESREKNR